MQSPDWYFHRLRAMTPRECAWRLASAARDLTDRVRVPLGAYPSDRFVRRAVEALSEPAPPRLCDVSVGEWREAAPEQPEHAWHERLSRHGRRLMQHRLDIFGREYQLGSPIDWNWDVVHRRATPLGFAAAIDYRDVAASGDAKIVWEPNRHQHLVVLARAYRATGDQAYVEAMLEQLLSWLDQCPFGRGMNWRSPLELGIRLVNWTFALDFVRDSGLLTPELWTRCLHAVHLHVWDIARKYSRGSSANNHVIGEAAGVFVATCYFDALPGAATYRDEALAILCREINAQTFSDGGSREQAFSYHLFVVELLLVAALVGRASGVDVPSPFWKRLETMLDFAAAFAEGGPVPAFGDSDDGYVLDLGDGPALQWLCCAGAILFDRGDLKAVAERFREPTRWLLGRSSVAAFAALPARQTRALQSRAFESGHYLLQCGDPSAADAISVVMDCGPLGFAPLAAHGHADALSITVRAFGEELLIDPGTYDYFSYPEWRAYFRSTRAHNTITIDGVDQSVQRGGFLWGRHARSHRISWQPSTNNCRVAGEHDGYRRLEDPLVHRRAVHLDGLRRTLTIHDDLLCAGTHDVELVLHFGERCRLVPVSACEWDIAVGGRLVRLRLERRLRTSSRHGGEQPGAGWSSRRYHQKQPITTLVGCLRIDGQTSLETRLEFGHPATVPQLS